MSQTSKTSDQNKSDIRHKRATIATICASTPVRHNAVSKQLSLSLSGISASPSSSEAKITSFTKGRLRQKNKILLKEKKRIDTKRITKDSNREGETKKKELINKSLNEKEKRKKKLKNKKKPVKKKRIVAQVKDTDNEWETESEKFINELSTSLRGSILKDNECINLFDNPCTPEKTREMPNMYTNLHESPIIGSSRRRLNLTLKKNDIIMQEKVLPVNLLPMEVSENPNEDEIIIRTEDNAEIHILSRKPEESQKQPENLSSFIQSPTYKQWDQPVKTYLGKRSRIDFIQRLPKVPRKEKNPISGMRCVAEYWNKALQKWVPRWHENSSTDSEYWDNDLQKWIPKRHEDSSPEEDFENNKRKKKTSKRNTRKQKGKVSRSIMEQRYNYDTSNEIDVENNKRKKKTSKRNTRKQKKKVSRFIMEQRYNYDTSNETDIEFETGGPDGKRMPFRDFCQKRRTIEVSLSSL